MALRVLSMTLLLFAPACCLSQVRMQAEGKLPAGAPRKYPSAIAAYGIIAR